MKPQYQQPSDRVFALALFPSLVLLLAVGGLACSGEPKRHTKPSAPKTAQPPQAVTLAADAEAEPAAQKRATMRVRKDVRICTKRLRGKICNWGGRMLYAGHPIFVEGDQPVDGQWRVVIYGDLKGWVLAGDLLTEQAFQQLGQPAPPVPKLWTDGNHGDPLGLKVGETIVIENTTKLKYGVLESPLKEPATLYLDWGPDSIALELPDGRSSPPSRLLERIGKHQRCLRDGTCVELQFNCKTGACDVVSLAATPKVDEESGLVAVVDVPSSLRRDWPAAPKKVVVFQLEHMTSRMGDYPPESFGVAWFAEAWLQRLFTGPKATEVLVGAMDRRLGLATSTIGRLEDFDADKTKDLDRSRHLCGKGAQAHLAKSIPTLVQYLVEREEYEKKEGIGLNCSFLQLRDYQDWQDEYDEYESDVPIPMDRHRISCTIGYYRDLRYDVLYFDRSDSGAMTLRGVAAIPMANDHDDDELGLSERSDQVQTRLRKKTCR